MMTPHTMVGPPGVSRIAPPLPGQAHVVMPQLPSNMAVPPPPIGVPPLVAPNTIPQGIPPPNISELSGIPPPNMNEIQGVPPPPLTGPSAQGMPTQLPPQGLIPQVLTSSIQTTQIVSSQLPPPAVGSQGVLPAPPGILPNPSIQLTQGAILTPMPPAVQGIPTTHGLLHGQAQPLDEPPPPQQTVRHKQDSA